jgi:hypothetical protein
LTARAEASKPACKMSLEVNNPPPEKDDWTLGKLIAIAVFTLGGFLIFIYNVSP